MKRSLLLTLCVVAIVATSFGQAKAAVTVQLNLRYNDPADTTEGGSWDLLAKTDNPLGIASLVAVISGIDFGTNGDLITLNPNIGALPIETKQSGTIVEFVYGQSPNSGQIGGVGTLGFAGRVVQDDLFTNASTTDFYDNMTKIASGFFGSARPVFTTYPQPPEDEGGINEATEWTNAGLTTVTLTEMPLILGGGDGVRGDSVATDGLLRGDANRDGIVNISDLTVLGANFSTVGTGTWATGDFTDDGNVNISDLTALGGNFSDSSPSPAITAVPEPSSVALVVLSIAGLAIRRNRNLGMC